MIAINPQVAPQVNNEYVDPSPIAPSSNGTEFTDMDEGAEEEKKEEPVRPAVRPMTTPFTTPRSPPSATQPTLTVSHNFIQVCWRN